MSGGFGARKSKDPAIQIFFDHSEHPPDRSHKGGGQGEKNTNAKQGNFGIGPMVVVTNDTEQERKYRQLSPAMAHFGKFVPLRIIMQDDFTALRLRPFHMQQA